MVASATLVEECEMIEPQEVAQHDESKKPSIAISSSARKASLPSYKLIRAAIPRECFEKSLPRSLFYLVLDYAIIAALYLVQPMIEAYGGWAAMIVWYWLIGMFASSLFCVGHDCGHGSFSNYKWANDFFGHVAHAPILAPFWPWAHSHQQHHQFTSHLNKDKGHPWTTREEYEQSNFFVRHFSKFPLSGFIRWNPIYTIVGLPDGSHFWPFSSLHRNATERFQCVVSGAACAFCAYIAFVLCDYSSLVWLKLYYVPILCQGWFLVLITYLQHSDEEIEVYEAGTWNFVRGQLQTIDRSFGFGIDSALHHITDGHVAHHFFYTKIPHYHLPAATRALRRVLAGYPNAYKHKQTFATAFEFLRLNIKLEYLIGRGTGVLKYNASKTYSNKTR